MGQHDAADQGLMGAAATSRADGITWIRLLLAAITLATFAGLYTGDFSNWDDPTTIWKNPHLNPPSITNTLYYWAHPHLDIYIPVTYTLWSALAWVARVPTADAQGIQLNPWVFHTANILIHLGAVLALFELLQRLVGNGWAAFAGAMLFAVHPVQVETVGWISGAKDLLYGFFSLLALWQYVCFAQLRQAEEQATLIIPAGRRRREARRRDAEGAPSPTRHYIAALVFLILALLSKPSAMMTPVIAAMIDYFLIRRSARAVTGSLWPWFVFSLPIMVLAKINQPGWGLTVWPVMSRPLIAADALAFYLYKLIFPLHLAPDYGRNPPVFLHSTARYWTWVVPVVVGWLLWKSRRRAPWLGVAGLIFVAALLPVLGFTPFDFQYYSTVADHYLYLAMLGPALALAMALVVVRKRWLAGLVGVLLIVLAGRAAAQALYWRSTPAIFEHTLAVNPNSGVSHERLGAYYHQLGNEALKAEADYRRAAAALAGHGDAKEASQATAEADSSHRRAMALLDKAGDEYKAVMAMSPRWPSPHLNLARVLSHQQRWDEAMAQLKIVAENQATTPAALRTEGDLTLFHQGVANYEQGRFAEAVEDFRRLRKAEPESELGKLALPIAGQRWEQSRRIPVTSPSATQAINP